MKDVEGPDAEKLKALRKKILDLCEKNDYAASLICLSIKPPDPDWSIQAERSWMIDTTFSADDEFASLLERYEKKEELNVEQRVKLLDFLNNIVAMEAQVAKFYMASYSDTQDMIKNVQESLGLDKSRIIPLEPSINYHIFTANDQTFQIHFDEDYRFFIKQLSGKDAGLKNEAMSLIGCIQPDGELFSTPTIPALSTGDKAMFQLYPFKPEKGITSEAFITGTIIDVVPSEHVN